MGDRHFLRPAEVCRRYGNIHRVTLWRWLRDPGLNFPKPHQIGGVYLWDPAILDAWDRGRFAEADGEAA